jgi:hypothetical protein
MDIPIDDDPTCEPSHPAAEVVDALECNQLRPPRELAWGMRGARERLADLSRQIESLR